MRLHDQLVLKQKFSLSKRLSIVALRCTKRYISEKYGFFYFAHFLFSLDANDVTHAQVGK